MRFKESGIGITVCLKNLLVTVKGCVGAVSTRFGGDDILFVGGEKFFLFSESSYRSYKNLMSSLVKGVSKGYQVELSLVGLGYKVIKLGNEILLKLGHSHYIKLTNPKGMHIFGSKKRLVLYGVNLSEVHHVSRVLGSFRKFDVYKGKGIVNVRDKVRLKVGKQK